LFFQPCSLLAQSPFGFLARRDVLLDGDELDKLPGCVAYWLTSISNQYLLPSLR